jgi:hypothetical protein
MGRQGPQEVVLGKKHRHCQDGGTRRRSQGRFGEGANGLKHTPYGLADGTSQLQEKFVVLHDKEERCNKLGRGSSVSGVWK